MKTKLHQWAKDLESLFYPKLCLACSKEALAKNTDICVKCEEELKITNFTSLEDNELVERFWGRIDVKYGFALYYFYKNATVQKLTHQLKYNNNSKIGIELGKRLGYELRETPLSAIDMIVPVPLHPKKKFKRGYNQSSKISEGLSIVLRKPWTDEGLIRVENTDSQTKKTKMKRFENVKSAFELKRPDLLKGKHILLIDDIITTGATIESCALELLKLEGVKVSIASIGMTKS